MHKFTDRRSLQEWVAQQKSQNKSIGFVPTMGALHPGHMSLIHQSKAENDWTVCSVFVNPTQFDNLEDLEKYPRDTAKDSQLLEENGCDVVFFPTIKDMYPQSTSSEKFTFGGLENQMEGKFRQGHFDGVATIVSRFFELVQPDKAYFGQKDFQQLRIIQEMVKQKNYPIEIVGMPIFREESGLAMSSRNMRLTPEFLKEAPIIFSILNMVKYWKLDHSVTQTIHLVEEKFRKTNLDLEYFMLCDEKTLEPVNSWDEAQHIRAFVACYAGEIRLIDNMRIE